MSYDPEARRDTPLARKLKARIRRDGPITVFEFMSACLADPEHGYYRTRAAIGARGDFITAPEISQVFGELIGLWCAVVWQQMGSPTLFNLIELGPGRGTLMRDALRAARIVPGFLAAAEVTLVEQSPALAGAQRAALAASGVGRRWLPSLAAVPAGAPAIVVANEFVDALPVAQLVRTEAGSAPRRVSLDGNERLVLHPSDKPLPADAVPVAGSGARGSGAIIEERDLAALLALVPLLETAPGAALILDYGHGATTPVDSLQAVRNHAFEHPLTSPGEADLTAQVDFEALGSCFEGRLRVDGPVTQAEFLGALGIAERASRLMAANPARAADIEAGVARLMAPNGMGTRFKAMGMRSRGLPPLPGFPLVDMAAAVT